MGRKQRLKQQRRAQRQAQPDTKATTGQPEPARPAGLSDRALEALIALLFTLLIFSIYANSLNGPFVLDDRPNIEINPHLRLTDLSFESITKAGTEGFGPTRVVPKITFALNYYFSGYDVTGYHIVNVVIHLITGILLYYFVKTTLGLPALRERYARQREIAFFVALIWLVHPLAAQSVAYIVQRMNSMVALFYVLSLLLYVQARLALGWKKWVLFSGSAVSGLLALGSKQNAATLPLFILLYEWYFLQDLSWPWLKRRAFFALGVLGVLVITVMVFLGTDPFDSILRGYDRYDFTLGERLLTELRVVMHYLSIIVVPHPSRLSLDKEFPLSHSLVDPITTLLSLAAIAGMLWLAWVTAKKDRLISFCVLWFLGNLVIESSVIALDIIFDHRTYLPSIGVVLLAVAVAYRLVKPRWVPVVLFAAVAAVFSVWAHQRSQLWSDPILIWRDIVQKNPTLERGHQNLAETLRLQGEYEEAIEHFQEALRIKPSWNAHYGLGLALMQQGKVVEGIEHFEEVVRINPSYKTAFKADEAWMHYYIGLAYSQVGKTEESLYHLSEAVRINPHLSKAYFMLGKLYKDMKQYAKAIDNYEKSLPENPDAYKAYNNLGVIYEAQGELDKALWNYQKAFSINKQYILALNNSASVYTRKREFSKAIDTYQQSLAINSQYADTYKGLALTYRAMNDDKKFREYLEKAHALEKR